MKTGNGRRDKEWRRTVGHKKDNTRFTCVHVCEVNNIRGDMKLGVFPTTFPIE